MKVLKVKCPSCKGQAVYHGFVEPKGVAIPCSTCGAKGWVPAKENFVDIEIRDDIQFVRVDGKNIPYAEFIAMRRANNMTD
jgi:hypothetical protein